MNTSLLVGDLVRLTQVEPDTLAQMESLWSQDSEFSRLLDWEPARRFSTKSAQKWIEKQFEKEDCFQFTIQTLEEARNIGFIGLDGITWTHGDAFVGIGLGEREYWGRGYGTDAMRIILRYAFTELNLRRVSLDVFEYNQRGVRSYEKAGFVHEGRARAVLLRESRRWDILYMGILRSEWLELEKERMEERS